MPNLALLDLVAPYVLRGQNLGAQHAALSVLRVVAIDTAADDFGTVVRGRCEFNGRLKIDPLAGGRSLSRPTSCRCSPTHPGSMFRPTPMARRSCWRR